MTKIQNKLLIVFSSSNKSNRLSNIYFRGVLGLVIYGCGVFGGV